MLKIIKTKKDKRKKKLNKRNIKMKKNLDEAKTDRRKSE